MKPTARTAYTADLFDGVLAIKDNSAAHPMAPTVTNDVEAVLHDLAALFKADLPPIIIYRDSEGIWDGIEHRAGTFIDFYPLRETNRDRAIAKAKARTGSSPRFNTFENQ